MPVFKALLTLAFPIILSNLFQAMYHLTDSFWVGRLGGSALASVSICGPIIFLAFSIGLGFAVAGSTFAAQYFGAKNHEMVNHTTAQTILVISLISLLLSSTGFIFAPNLLQFMGATSDIFPMALSFLRISFISVIFNFSFFIFQSIMRGIGKVKIPLFIVIGTVLINFIIDPILIFGFGPIPPFGPSGAALATLITQSLAAIAGFIILFGSKWGLDLKFHHFRLDLKFIKKAFLIGLPASIEQSSRNLAMIVMISLIAGFGTTAIASYGAGTNLIQIAILVGLGLAAANGTLVGQNIGAKDMIQAVRVSKLSAVISFFILSFIGLIVFLFSRQFISFFIPSDSAVIDGGSHFIRIVALGFGFIGLHMSFGHVFLAAGKSSTSMTLTLLSQWLIQIPLAYFLSQHTSLGINGLWIALPVTNITIAFIAFLIYKKGSWQKVQII